MFLVYNFLILENIMITNYDINSKLYALVIYLLIFLNFVHNVFLI